LSIGTCCNSEKNTNKEPCKDLLIKTLHPLCFFVASLMFKDADWQCAICLTNAKALKEILKCGHVFHSVCMEAWRTQGKDSCPLCRRDTESQVVLVVESSKCPSRENVTFLVQMVSVAVAIVVVSLSLAIAVRAALK
jgi:hypothetical protein